MLCHLFAACQCDNPWVAHRRGTDKLSCMSSCCMSSCMSSYSNPKFQSLMVPHDFSRAITISFRVGSPVQRVYHSPISYRDCLPYAAMLGRNTHYGEGEAYVDVACYPLQALPEQTIKLAQRGPLVLFHAVPDPNSLIANENEKTNPGKKASKPNQAEAHVVEQSAS